MPRQRTHRVALTAPTPAPAPTTTTAPTTIVLIILSLTQLLFILLRDVIRRHMRRLGFEEIGGAARAGEHGA